MVNQPRKKIPLTQFQVVPVSMLMNHKATGTMSLEVVQQFDEDLAGLEREEIVSLLDVLHVQVGIYRTRGVAWRRQKEPYCHG